ncbi:MAG: ATP-binding cassette domain-containing protein [Actinomycetota bacterium]|nr:ATP-binding cassette domain-containing protein [Actinomycetota bacterium]
MTITAQDLGVQIDGTSVLKGESLDCASATMTALVGPSGCGKTTLLHCLGMLQRPDSGKVLIDGADTSGWSEGRIRRYWRDHASFVIQDYGIVDDESVAYNVTMSASVLTNRVKGDRSRWENALAMTGLGGRGGDAASHLSGGEKQRLAIARAIYKDAQVIYIDEPTASLDAANRRRVIELFAERAAAGCTVIVATHDEEMMEACGVLHAVGAQRLSESRLEVAR